MKLNKEQAEKLTQSLTDTDFLSDLGYTIDEDMDSDEISEDIETRIREYEVIYYTTAMEFLLENDPSLHDSLEIAEEFGFEVSGLGSEILATLLMQGRMMDDLNSIDFEDI